MNRQRDVPYERPHRPSPLRRWPALTQGVTLLLLSPLLACGSSGRSLTDGAATDSSETNADAASCIQEGCSDTIEPDPVNTALKSSHVAIVLKHPENTKVSELEHETIKAQTTTGGGDCSVDRAEVTGKGRTLVVIQAVAATCSHGQPQPKPGNGRHGAYVTLADASHPTKVTRASAALGPAVFFDQSYFECTNSCRQWTEPVGLVTLDHPTDPAYPTVMAYSPTGNVSRGELQRYAIHLH